MDTMVHFLSFMILHLISIPAWVMLMELLFILGMSLISYFKTLSCWDVEDCLLIVMVITGVGSRVLVQASVLWFIPSRQSVLMRWQGGRQVIRLILVSTEVFWERLLLMLCRWCRIEYGWIFDMPVDGNCCGSFAYQGENNVIGSQYFIQTISVPYIQKE